MTERDKGRDRNFDKKEGYYKKDFFFFFFLKNLIGSQEIVDYLVYLGTEL